MNNHLYIVYIHTNLINNKKYIGITCRKPAQRWLSDGSGYLGQPKFWNAIRKYGWKNFSHDIVATDLTEEEALKLESYYIEKFNTIDNGYNVLNGGISSYPRNKPVYCITTKKQYNSITEAEQDTGCLSSAIIENIKGKRGPIKGLQWAYWDSNTNNYIEPILFVPKPRSNKKRVYCIETDTWYESILEAAQKNNIDDRDLRKVLCGKRNGIKNKHFIREEDYSEEKVLYLLKLPIRNYSRVYCQELDMIFDNFSDAGKYIGVSSQSIMKNCQGKTKTCKELHFYYLNNYPAEFIWEQYKKRVKGEAEEDDEV